MEELGRIDDRVWPTVLGAKSLGYEALLQRVPNCRRRLESLLSGRRNSSLHQGPSELCRHCLQNLAKSSPSTSASAITWDGHTAASSWDSAILGNEASISSMPT